MEENRLNIKMITEAKERIGKYVSNTPLDQSIYLSNEKQNVFLKLENTQSVKAFKIRGALNKILSLSDEEKSKGIATTSSGNHGISVSYGAKLVGGIEATTIVPKSTPQSKIDKIAHYGGKVIIHGDNYDDANLFGQKYIKERQLTFIDGWDNDPYVYAGQGTVGIEILGENPKIDTILVPVGGGGILTGIAVAAKEMNPNVNIIGIQTEACPAYVASRNDNKCYGEYPTSETICEALVGGIGQLAFEMRNFVDETIVVSEDYIKRAISHLAKKEKLIAEPSGAIAVAAVLQHREKITGQNIALVITGGNIDDSLMVEILNNY